MNEYFNNTSNPQPNSSGSSSLIRAEFASIKAGFDKLPTIAGNGGEFVRINAGATALETTGDVVASLTVAATGKTTPVDADLVPLVDSEASNVLKKLTWANLKATLKTYFDSVTTTLTNKTIALGSNTVSGTLAQFNAAVSDADLVSIAGTETLTNKTLTSPDINGGTIDGTVIGSTTPAAVSATTLSAVGPITSTTTGTGVSGIKIYSTNIDAANRNWIVASNKDAYGDFHIAQSNAAYGDAFSAGTSWLKISPTGAVTIPGGITPESVIAPTLLNSWVNAGGASLTAGYWKDTFGVVHLRGLIKDGTTTAATVLFALPSGYRPSANLYIPVVSGTGLASVYITSGGDVSINTTAGVNISLDSITFRAA